MMRWFLTNHAIDIPFYKSYIVRDNYIYNTNGYNVRNMDKKITSATV